MQQYSPEWLQRLSVCFGAVDSESERASARVLQRRCPQRHSKPIKNTQQLQPSTLSDALSLTEAAAAASFRSTLSFSVELEV